MKKIVFLLALVFILTSCGEIEINDSITSDTKISEEVKPMTGDLKTDIVKSNSVNEEEIPNHPGDKGKYYLIESEINNGIVKALHKRVGVDSIGYSKTEINCKTKQVRDLGYSEESSVNIIEKPGEWYDIIEGSSKSYLLDFLCNKYSSKLK